MVLALLRPRALRPFVRFLLRVAPLRERLRVVGVWPDPHRRPITLSDMARVTLQSDPLHDLRHLGFLGRMLLRLVLVRVPTVLEQPPREPPAKSLDEAEPEPYPPCCDCELELSDCQPRERPRDEPVKRCRCEEELER